MSKPTIMVREDGPYVVKNLDDLRAPEGEAIQAKAAMPLCRCGLSDDKPFCDGSHREQGWKADGQADDPKGEVHRYEGDGFAILYNTLTCSHAGKCVDTSRAAFDPDRRPWIDPSQPREVLRAAISACPSGALAWEEGGAQDHVTATGASIRVGRENGPLEVTGCELEGEWVWPEASTREKYVLCRCGKSSNKPFCDGTHTDIDWDGSLDTRSAPEG